MGSECQPGNDQQLQRLSDRIRTAKNRGRERDGRSRFRNFVALTLGEGDRQPKKRHRSPPCVSPGTKKTPNIFSRETDVLCAEFFGFSPTLGGNCIFHSRKCKHNFLSSLSMALFLLSHSFKTIIVLLDS